MIRHLVSSSVVTGLAQVVVFVVRFATISVLARLLTPSDFGLVNVFMVLILLLARFGEDGLCVALIQGQRKLDHVVWNTVFWINAALAAAMAIVLIAGAEAIAGFFDAEGGALVLRVLGVLGAVRIVASIALSELRRDLRFGRIAACNVAAAVLGSAAAIAAALAGAGIWALVVQQGVTIAIETVGWTLSTRFRPGRCLSLARTRETLRRGASFSLVSFAGYLVFESPALIVARSFDLTRTGLFTVSRRLSGLPKEILGTTVVAILFPAFASLRDDPARLGPGLKRALAVTVAIQAPVFAGMAVLSAEAVRLVLGPSWVGAIPVFALLALANAIDAPATCIAPFLKGVADPGRLLRLQAARAVIVVAACIAGTWWGLVGVAVGLCVANALYFPLVARMAFALVGIGPAAGALLASRPLAAAAVMAGAVHWLLEAHLRPLGSDLLSVAGAVAFGIPVYAAAVFLISRPTFDEAVALGRVLRRPAGQD